MFFYSFFALFIVILIKPFSFLFFMVDDLVIWTEKYRPRSFSEVKGQSEIVKRVEAFVKQKNMPHLLFAGPAGVGKTTLSLVVARELFGDSWRENFLELNASDERGIDVIRNKVKDFARTKALGDVPFKIIYLDECDALTKEAQQALRRTMENYTHTCRFILSCNYSSKIIDPIQSRCTVFRFKPLSESEINDIIDRITKSEGLKVSDSARKALFEVSGGDVRRLENILQACAAISKDVSDDLVFSISSYAKPQEVSSIISFCVKQNFVDAKKQLLNVMLNYGLAGLDVVKQLQQALWSVDGLSDSQRLAMSVACGEAEFRMVEGADEFVQLESLIANFCLIASKN